MTINLLIAILMAIGFVGGIPLLIISASNRFTFGLVTGIILTVVGFYGTPIQFIHFANLKATARVIDCVLVENIYTVSEIAEHLQDNEKSVAQKVTYAVNHEYLLGYKFDGTTLSANNNKKIKRAPNQTNKCPNCGGALERDEHSAHCPYCNSTFLD